jgi:hypothetical protein
LSACNGGMSVSGKDLECSGVPVMATERDDMRNQSWTDAQQPCYACEMVITTAGIYQAMIPMSAQDGCYAFASIAHSNHIPADPLMYWCKIAQTLDALHLFPSVYARHTTSPSSRSRTVQAGAHRPVRFLLRYRCRIWYEVIECKSFLKRLDMLFIQKGLS